MDNQLDKLLLEWKSSDFHKDKVFIEDGIIEYEIWKEQSCKILFLAKEAYTYDDYGFDLREMIRNKEPFGNWFTVAHWVNAILELKQNPEKIPSFYSEFDTKEMLRKIAFVNTKKSSGYAQSNYEDIQNYVVRDKQYLKRQIDLINPDVILCNYTFYWVYKKIYDNDSENIREISDLVHKHGKRIVIDFWHFANRYPKEMNFYTLCAVINKSKVFQEDL